VISKVAPAGGCEPLRVVGASNAKSSYRLTVGRVPSLFEEKGKALQTRSMRRSGNDAVQRGAVSPRLLERKRCTMSVYRSKQVRGEGYNTTHAALGNANIYIL
jgi:hypothetical protein